MIILEGMDNSGKSTLAKQFGLDILHPGPAPRTKYEELSCLRVQLENARKPIVQDRVTCISSQVYGRNPDFVLLNDYLKQMLSTPHCIVIYCRPPIETIVNFSTHKAKAHDNADHLRNIQENALELVSKYDRLMSRIPHLSFDWTGLQQIDWSLVEFTQYSHGAWSKWSKEYAK